MTGYRNLLLGTLAYTIITFAIAVLWHVVIFKEKYQAFGYFSQEPNLLLGFLTILIQGFILCSLFPKTAFAGSPTMRAMKFAFCAGAFLWTSHVLAFLAKQTLDSPAPYLLMESFYLCLQFGLFGIVLSVISSGARIRFRTD